MNILNIGPHLTTTFNDTVNDTVGRILSSIDCEDYNFFKQGKIISHKKSLIESFISTLVTHLYEGSFDNITQYRDVWKTQFSDILKYADGLYLDSGAIYTWEYMVKDLIFKFHNFGMLDDALIQSFFGVNCIKCTHPNDLIKSLSEVGMQESDYYYKGIGIPFLFMKQLISENFICFGEPTDHFSDIVSEAYLYAYGHPYKKDVSRKGYMLMINKKKLSSFLENIKINGRYREHSSEITMLQSYDYYLTNIIVPISCVDCVAIFSPLK